jgi:molybdenum cofactor cytidylyltransferase
VIQLTAMTAEAESTPQVAAIVLAAGGSTRMGQIKQLLPVDGQPMVRRVTAAACATKLAQVVVVVGACADAVRQALTGLPVDIVVNEAWVEGMSTSIKAGLGALNSGIQAALIILADQPGLTPDLLDTLVARYHATRAPIIAPFYQGQRGNPVLFDRSLFGDLGVTEGDQGGRVLVLRYAGDLEPIEVDDPSILLDIDTHQDYERTMKSRLQR